MAALTTAAVPTYALTRTRIVSAGGRVGGSLGSLATHSYPRTFITVKTVPSRLSLPFAPSQLERTGRNGAATPRAFRFKATWPLWHSLFAEHGVVCGQTQRMAIINGQRCVQLKPSGSGMSTFPKNDSTFFPFTATWQLTYLLPGSPGINQANAIPFTASALSIKAKYADAGMGTDVNARITSSSGNGNLRQSWRSFTPLVSTTATFGAPNGAVDSAGKDFWIFSSDANGVLTQVGYAQGVGQGNAISVAVTAGVKYYFLGSAGTAAFAYVGGITMTLSVTDNAALPAS